MYIGDHLSQKLFVKSQHTLSYAVYSCKQSNNLAHYDYVISFSVLMCCIHGCVSFRSGSVNFDLTWKKKVLDKNYGVPRDMAKLAADVYRAITEGGGLIPKKFNVHGKLNTPGPKNIHEYKQSAKMIYDQRDKYRYIVIVYISF